MNERWCLNCPYGLCDVDDLIKIANDFKRFFVNYKQEAGRLYIASIEMDDANNRVDIETNYFIGRDMYYQKFIAIDGKFMDGMAFHEMLKKKRKS